MLAPPKKWAMKKVKEYTHLEEVPFDIAKQYIALTLANKFNELLKLEFPTEDIFLNYLSPYLAIPLYNQEHRYVFEIEEYQEENPYIQFDSFSKPKGDKFSTKL